MASGQLDYIRLFGNSCAIGFVDKVSQAFARVKLNYYLSCGSEGEARTIEMETKWTDD